MAGKSSRRITNKLRRPAISLLFVVALVILASSMIRPSNDRTWKEDHSRMAAVELDGDLAHVTGIRDFRYSSPDSYQTGYYDRTFDLARIETVWFVLATFNEEEWRGPAHSMLSFGFEGGEFVVISVEARKEVGEDYSIWKGLIKRFEVIYVIGDERDLIGIRAIHRSDDVYVYPIKTTREKVRALFVDMLRKADDLRTHPEFYNSLTNNCTSKLRDHVNAIAPGRVPPSWRLVFPGYADELIRGLGLMDSDLALDEARERFWVNDRARRYEESADFSFKIRDWESQAGP